MLIQQRQSTKKTWPNMWDVSTGGFVREGETTGEAGERETKEELGVIIDLTDKAPVCSFYYEDSIHDVYCVDFKNQSEADFRFSLQEEEVQDICWASEEHVLKRIEEGSFIPVHKEFISLLFRMNKHRGIMA